MYLSEVSLVLANSVDYDEMRHFAAFYLGLHCLQNNAFLAVSIIQRFKEATAAI